MIEKPRCHYDSEWGWLTPEHLRDCDDHDCAGCRPCPKTHCAMRGRCANHVEVGAGIITCPSCIGRVKRDLHSIEELYTLAAVTVEARHGESSPLLEEATDAGIESEAFSIVGPAPLPTTREARVRWIRSGDQKRGWCEWPSRIEADDPHHPFAVLGRWDMMLREEYGPKTQLTITVPRAAHYLRELLAGPFPHGDQFDDFCHDITRCRTHLEDVIHDSREPETGRHCPTCVAERGKGPRLRKRYADHDTSGASDTWHCPADTAHWWSEADYRRRVATDYLEYAEALTAGDMQTQYGIRPGSLRGWASKGRVHKRGKNEQGRTLYDVADALICKRADEHVA